MSRENKTKSLAALIGTSLVVGLAAAPLANATDNPFVAKELSRGYMVAEQSKEGACGASMTKTKEGSCGGTAAAEKKPAEGNCGGNKPEKTKEGSCGGKK